MSPARGPAITPEVYRVRPASPSPSRRGARPSRRECDGSFAEFAGRIARAPLRFPGGGVRYESPSQGRLERRWRGPLLRDGVAPPVPLGDFARYETPWGSSGLPLETLTLQEQNERLHLRWAEARREVSRSI